MLRFGSSRAATLLSALMVIMAMANVSQEQRINGIRTRNRQSSTSSSALLDERVKDALNELDPELAAAAFEDSEAVNGVQHQQSPSVWTCLDRIGRAIRMARQYPVLVGTGTGLRALAASQGCSHLIALEPRQGKGQGQGNTRESRRRQPGFKSGVRTSKQMMTFGEQLEAALTENIALPRGDLCPKSPSSCQGGVWILVHAYFCLSFNNPTCCICFVTEALGIIGVTVKGGSSNSTSNSTSSG